MSGGFDQGDAAVLDPHLLATLDAMVGGDAEMRRMVVTAFLEDAPERIRELHEGLSSGDAELVRRAAHTLKSTGLSFGARDLAEACRELEEAARAGRLDDPREHVARVEAEWARTRPAIEGLLA